MAIWSPHMTNRFVWVIWALVLLIGTSVHFGPGQKLLRRERGAALLAKANAARIAAEMRQSDAARLTAVRIAAKRQARATGASQDIASAERAIMDEKAANQEARDAWASVAELLGQVQTAWPDAPSGQFAQIQLQRSRALIGSGKVFTAAADLELLLADLSEAGQDDGSLTRQVRAEMASAYYMGARELRVSGEPDAEWRLVSALARQQFRHLAEQPVTNPADAELRRVSQRNLEVVLDLEQRPIEEVEASPTPYPPSNCDCDKEDWRRRPSRASRKKVSRELMPGDPNGDYRDDGW
jgi:hypothetical protein